MALYKEIWDNLTILIQFLKDITLLKINFKTLVSSKSMILPALEKGTAGLKPEMQPLYLKHLACITCTVESTNLHNTTIAKDSIIT